MRALDIESRYSAFEAAFAESAEMVGCGHHESARGLQHRLRRWDLLHTGYLRRRGIAAGKERLVEITKIAPMVVFAGSARVPIGGKIVPPEAKPFVRFLNRKTGEPVDVVTSAHTDATYHLYKVGDRVALNAGGVSAVRSVTRPAPSEIAFFCD